MNIQWPQGFIKPSNYDDKLSEKKSSILKKEIEYFFTKKFSYKSILVPSARAGIALIIKFYNLNRSHEIFVSKWSPYCVLNTISFFSNPTTSLKNANMVIANHNWANEHKLKKGHKKIVIEDSADTIHLSKKSFFLNNSEFEIVSLPKIIGSYSGGLIYTKNKSFIKFIAKEQKKNINLGRIQSKYKNLEARNQKKVFHSWYYNESTNTYVDINSLIDIKKNLKNFETNKNTILKRLTLVKKKNKGYRLNKKKIGPVVLLPKKSFKQRKCKIKLPEYHVNYSKFLSKEKYEKSYLFPIHFMIKDKMFIKIFNSIKQR